MRFSSKIVTAVFIGTIFSAQADTGRTGSPYLSMTQQPFSSTVTTPMRIDYKAVQKASERNKVIEFAKTLIGTPYRYGGTTPQGGFDCSGLVRFVFAKLGHNLPRVSAAQYQALDAVKEPQIGDLVFFGNGKRVTHVGIHVGDGKMLHAPSSGKTVTIDNYTRGYWGKRYLGARTVLPAQQPQTQIATLTTGKEKTSGTPLFEQTAGQQPIVR